MGLEANIVEMDNTYVTLFSQKTFKIYNKSELPVQFEFKSLSSGIEDEKAHELRRAAPELRLRRRERGCKPIKHGFWMCCSAVQPAHNLGREQPHAREAHVVLHAP